MSITKCDGVVVTFLKVYMGVFGGIKNLKAHIIHKEKLIKNWYLQICGRVFGVL